MIESYDFLIDSVTGVLESIETDIRSLNADECNNYKWVVECYLAVCAYYERLIQKRNELAGELGE